MSYMSNAMIDRMNREHRAMMSHDYARLYHRGFCRLQSHDRRRRVRQRVALALFTLFFIAVLAAVGSIL